MAAKRPGKGAAFALVGAALGACVGQPQILGYRAPVAPPDASTISPTDGGADASDAGPQLPPGAGWVQTFGDEFTNQPSSADFLSQWTPEWTWWENGSWTDDRHNNQCDCDYSAASLGWATPDTLLLTVDKPATPAGAGTYSAAIATTFHSFSQTYGFFSARIRFLGQVGMGSGFYMFPRTAQPEASHEIDIALLAGLASEDSNGQVGHTVNFGYAQALADGGYSSDGTASVWESPVPLSDDFHVYAMDWEPDGVTWYIDGVAVFTAKLGVPSEPYYLQLVTSVGLLNDPIGRGTPTASTAFPASMEVDWVRVYQRQ